MLSYDDYTNERSEEIVRQLKAKGCQPILFLGSGLSKRYFDAPTWDELLRHLLSECKTEIREYAYHKQATTSSAEVGSLLAGFYREWAWGEGRSQYPTDYFHNVPADRYLKYSCAEYLKSLTPATLKDEKLVPNTPEIEALRQVQPHAIITTNYDQFLETIFPDYEVIIGQKILRTNYASVGEILKIHGCVNDVSSIILTAEDYELWNARKKYLSAKLLTYFAEHVLVFIGYSAGDTNIQAILSDIDEILAEQSGLVPNIFFVHYDPDAMTKTSWATERPVNLEGNRTIRMQNIETDSLGWIYKALGSATMIENLRPKLLRSLLAKNYELVRHDIPRNAVAVNFEMLEHVVSSDGELAQVLGISTLDDPKVFNLMYPYTLTEVARKLGYNHWHGANVLMTKVLADQGFDIKASDNQYHFRIKFGSSEKSSLRKYSMKLVDLLQSVKNGEDYTVENTLVSQPSEDF